MNKDDGYPAFPVISDMLGHDTGISRRDYFASKAMQGICVNLGRNGLNQDQEKEVAELAYRISDAMIEVRNG